MRETRAAPPFERIGAFFADMPELLGVDRTVCWA
jgi:hypothetical protein